MVLDESKKALILAVTNTALLAPPCVLSAAVDTQPPAHGHQPELASMLAHECVLALTPWQSTRRLLLECHAPRSRA